MQGRVVSGHKAVLAEVQAQAIGQGAMKVTPLAVSGAFHTPLMQPAQDSLRKVVTCPAHITIITLHNHPCITCLDISDRAVRTSCGDAPRLQRIII